MRFALQALTPEALVRAAADITLGEARKVVSAVHRTGSLSRQVRHVRKASLEAVRRLGELPELSIREERHSRIDPFVKYVLNTPDGLVIETVRIPLERPGRFSVCVSSQAGCGLGCCFCATGRLGLRRSLKAWEIVEQVRIVRCGLDGTRAQRVHGVVFQGMGEPLANLDNVIEAIRVLAEPSALAVDGRNITVCTAGIPAGIRRLAVEMPKVRLALSVASARPEIRRVLMPIDRAFPLAQVLEASMEHARLTGLAPMWALTLLAGVNDSEDDARALAALAREFASRTGLRPRISIVPYNSIDEGAGSFSRSSPERETAYHRTLRQAGVGSHRRYSGGGDVNAACGQLAGG